MADMEKLEQRISELERRIQMQEDIRAIERLQANYWDCLDKKDWDGLRACFTDDFVFINNTTGGRYVGGDGMPPKWLSPIFAVRATSRRDLRTARTHIRFSLCDSRSRITKMECILK